MQKPKVGIVSKIVIVNSTDTFHDVDQLFLLTPFQSNIDLTSNLVNGAKYAQIKHIVKLSVMGADAEPVITPSRLHRQAEKIIEESQIPFTFLRPNFFMQNFVNFFSHTIKSQNAFYVPAGDGQISMVDVRDVASLQIKCLLVVTTTLEKPIILLEAKHYRIIKLLRYFLEKQERR